jgi:transcription elongation factor GreB
MVVIGRTTRLVDVADGSEQNVCVVDVLPEEPVDGGVLHVSAVSPIGQALQRRRVGETVEVHAPRGRVTYRIEQVL